MDDGRTCAWMSGPDDSSLSMSGARWWLAISRDLLATSSRQQRTPVRAPAVCDRTPMFASPLRADHGGTARSL
ncbi:MAG TPA: hypothetical protein VNC78_04655 [Actinomycetota bacterium]|nr:hypothetical protein [Actinomycetota bacterium]